jgi:hypothetical protein
MAEQQQVAALEMRVAELEDKLRQLTVSEDEMRAYQKVAAMLGRAAPAAAAPVGPLAAPTAPPGAPISPISPIVNQCIIQQCIVNQCIIHQCIINNCWPPPIITQCLCNQCSCIVGGGGAVTTGFGGFGR